MTAQSMSAAQDAVLATYLPRLVEDWHGLDQPSRLLEVDGTLVSADISGFTALSERLAAFGHEGAEELTDLLNRCFTQMIAAVAVGHGDVIKFGGDALLILFSGSDHATRAVRAMALMRAVVAQQWSTRSVGRVQLGISQGAHSGTFHFSVVDGGHLELFVAGPAVSATVQCESDAGRGHVLVSAATASLLRDDWLGDPTPSGARRLRPRRVDIDLGDLDDLVDEDRGTAGLEAYLAPALAEQVVVASPGEHRMVSIAFMTIGATDELVEQGGPDALHEAIDLIAANVRHVLETRRVHWLACDAYVNGGKIILAAGAPTSTSEDEDQMLLALHEIMALPSPLPLKVGVNRGRVFFGDLGSPTRRTFTVMGDAVNLAARLMQKAGPGEIVASHFILDQAATTFTVDELEPFLVKGKSDPINAAILRSPREDLDPDDTVHVSEVPFVGRVAELDLLAQAATSAMEGEGRFVELFGEAGIGKSRLISETLDRHPELPSMVLRGGQYARNTPYFVVRRLLRDVVGLTGTDDPAEAGASLREFVAQVAPAELPWLPLLAIVFGVEVEMTPEVQRLAEQFRRERLIATTVEVIDAVGGGSPTAIVAEDAYWFDEASLEVLQALGRRAPERPWLIIATLRPDNDRVLPDEPEALLLQLEPLGVEDTLQLTATASTLTSGDALDDRIGDLAARGGGHPLFILELVSAAGAGDETLPESIESLVTTRIDTLDPADRLLLREASVGGAVVDPVVLAQALDRPGLAEGDRWVTLQDFLEPEGERFRFRHAMYHDVAYQGLSYSRRRDVHLRLGNTIEAGKGAASKEVAPLLSLHFYRANDFERAWSYSAAAADDARSAYANSEAITLYVRALEVAGRLRDVSGYDVGRVAESLADVYELDAQYDLAFTACQRSRNSSGVQAEARLMRKIGRIRQRQAQYTQSLRWFGRGIQQVDAIEDRRRRANEEAELSLGYAGTLHRQGRNIEAAKWAERARLSAVATGDKAVLAAAFNMLDVVSRALDRPDEGYTDAALELFRAVQDLVGEANVLNNIGVRAYFAGDWELAAERYEASRLLRQEAGDVVGEGILTNNLAEVLSFQGHYQRAEALLIQARNRMARAGYRVGAAYAATNLAMVLARSGDVEAGIELLRDAERDFDEMGASALSLEVQIRRVEVLLLAGDDGEAVACAFALQEHLASDHAGNDEFIVQLEPLAGIALARVGRLEEAEATLTSAVDRSAAAGNSYCAALAWAGRAMVAAERGQDTSRATEAAAELLGGLGIASLPPVARCI